MAQSQQIKEIADKLEQGIKDLFESDNYGESVTCGTIYQLRNKKNLSDARIGALFGMSESTITRRRKKHISDGDFFDGPDRKSCVKGDKLQSREQEQIEGLPVEGKGWLNLA